MSQGKSDSLLIVRQVRLWSTGKLQIFLVKNARTHSNGCLLCLNVRAQVPTQACWSIRMTVVPPLLCSHEDCRVFAAVYRGGLTEETRLPACMSPCCSFLWRSRPWHPDLEKKKACVDRSEAECFQVELIAHHLFMEWAVCLRKQHLHAHTDRGALWWAGAVISLHTNSFCWLGSTVIDLSCLINGKVCLHFPCQSSQRSDYSYHQSV